MNDREIKKRVSLYLSFLKALILDNANAIAVRQKAELEIQHIDKAYYQLFPPNKKFWSKELLLIIGSSFFGAFVQGFITEINSGNETLVIIYGALGILGIILCVLGIVRS